jgi:uracil-DNA glycosylase
MAWSERQHRMLRAMGLRSWSAPTASVASTAEAAAATPSSPATQPPTSAAVSLGPTAAASAVGTASTAGTFVRAGSAFSRGTAGAPSFASAASTVSATGPAGPAGPAALAERAQRVSTLDWPALREAVANCSACTLCQGRQQTVFGAGHPQARWLVVGEAPGEQEDLSGEPFVGAAGQLLDRMLAALQLTRAPDGPQPLEQRVYIANTLKCRPPRNRNPVAEESALCEPFLLRQVALLQPRIILAMGRFAVQSLLQTDEPIGRLRGRVHQYRGVPLVVTYHPAYLLRNLPDKAKAWEDLCLAAQVFESGSAPSPAP